MNTTTERQPTVLERRPLDTLSVNDLATLRRIIGEVIDAGCTIHKSPWLFNAAWDAEHNAAERTAFIEAVVDKVIETAVPRLADAKR